MSSGIRDDMRVGVGESWTMGDRELREDVADPWKESLGRSPRRYASGRQGAQRVGIGTKAVSISSRMISSLAVMLLNVTPEARPIGRRLDCLVLHSSVSLSSRTALL